jgi:DNA-binding protein Fis
MGVQAETPVVVEDKANFKKIGLSADVVPPKRVVANPFPSLTEIQQAKLDEFAAKSATGKFLRELSEQRLILFLNKCIAETEMRPALQNLPNKNINADKLLALDSATLIQIQTIYLKKAFFDYAIQLEPRELKKLLDAVALKSDLPAFYNKLADETKFNALISLSALEITTFVGLDDSTFAYVKTLDSGAASTLLTAISKDKKLAALCAGIQPKTNIPKLQKLDAPQIDKLDAIQANYLSLVEDLKEVDFINFVKKCIDSPVFYTVLETKKGAKSNIVEMLGLSDKQLTAYKDTTDTTLLATFAKYKAKPLAAALTLLADNPNFKTVFAKLTDKASFERLTELTDAELKVLMTTTVAADLNELAIMPLPQLQAFCSLSATELKNYFDTTNHKPALKTAVKSLNANQLKQFSTDFTTANNANVKDTLDYLELHPTFLEYWSLLPSARTTAVERTSKNLFLSVDTVIKSDVAKHADGEINLGVAKGGHNIGTLTYKVADGYIYSQSGNIRFTPAQVVTPNNYASTAPFPYTSPPSPPPPPATIPAPDVKKTSRLEVLSPPSTWVAKTDSLGISIGSTMFPSTWDSKRIEAETALAYMKISDNPAGTKNPGNGNAYEVRDTDGNVIRVCIGVVGASAFIPTVNRDTLIYTTFPI